MKNKLLLGSALVVLSTALSGCATDSHDFIYQSLAKAGQGWSGLPAYDRGKHYLLVGDYGLALEAFGGELAHDPTSVRALNGAAIAYERIGRGDVAEKLFDKALKIEPKSAVTLNNLAYLYMTRGDRAGALALVERAKAAPTNNATVEKVVMGNAALLGIAVPKRFAEADAAAPPAAAPVVPVITKPLAELAAEAARESGQQPVAAAPPTPGRLAEATPAPFVPAPLVPSPVLPPSIHIPSPKPTPRVPQADAPSPPVAPASRPTLEASQPMRLVSPNLTLPPPQVALAEPAAAVQPPTLEASASVRLASSQIAFLAPQVDAPAAIAPAQAAPTAPRTPHPAASSGVALAHTLTPRLTLTARAPVRFASQKINGPALQAVFETPMIASFDVPGGPGLRIPVAGRLLGTLSVVNGSGRDRMAHRIGRYLTGKGFHVDRLANAKSFGRRHSLLFCHPASQQSAELIARAMPVPVQVVVMKSDSDRIELVAGRDLDAFDERLASLKIAQR